MNLSFIDWSIVLVVGLFLFFQAYRAKKYTRSVADFLSANRSAGKYLLAIGEGAAALGAITIVADFQKTYSVGFGASWWGNLQVPMLIILMISGFVIYRYRETRVMTMAEFLEIRYSRNFRVFAGLVMFTSGILNFGIFPAVAANFFISFCGFPENFMLYGLLIPTYPILTFILIACACYFTFIGGQIGILITDFIQGFFVNIVMLGILIVVLIKFNFGDLFQSLLLAEEGHSMVNPFKTGAIKDFNIWFFMIGIFLNFYNRLGWQGNQAFNCSAKNPHEAKMAAVLGGLRGWAFLMSLTILPLVAYMLMHNPEYSDVASNINSILKERFANNEVRHQMITPVAMTTFLPIGFMGAFTVVIFAAFICTGDSNLHSWSSILVQDIILPLSKKKLTPESHIKLLRLAVLGVAIFIYLFSLYFSQTQHILLFFMVTGAIWLGGSGAVIIGGLYWKRGTTFAAWLTLIIGASISLLGLGLDQIWMALYDKNFPIDYKWITVISMISSISIYVLVSLFGPREIFDLDRMLHRGKYSIEKDRPKGKSIELITRFKFKDIFGITQDFTFGDKLIYLVYISYNSLQFLVWVAVTTVAFTFTLTDQMWANYFKFFFGVIIITSFFVALWISIGGLFDIVSLFKSLKCAERDSLDNGEHLNG